MTGFSLTAALVVAAVLGICFRTTRAIGIGAFSILCAFYAWLACIVLIVVAAIAYHHHKRR